MKTLKQISLLCLFWMIGMSVSAYDFTATNADGVTIYYNITSSTSPKTVEVTKDFDSWFESYYAQTINIPNTVTYNGNTYGVTGISSRTFSSCSSVKSITLPKYLTSIGDEAFVGCSGLASLTIPNSVTSIGDEAFDGCSGLTSLKVEDGNTYYDSREGCNAIIEKSSNTLIVGCKNTIIPNSVTSIGDDAFRNCLGLTSLTIPNSVKSIGDYAFYYCIGLTSLTIPNSVTSIGNSAFTGCSGMTSITIPNSVKSIGNYAFYNCSNLSSLTIPNSVTSIGLSAFKGCSGLTSVAIPNSVMSIGISAFEGCSGLTSVTIGNSVTSIGTNAFADCENATILFTSTTKPNQGYKAFSNVKAVYYPRFYGWSTEAPYMPYTTLITDANGNYIFEDLDDWGELEIKENCKEYKVIADVSAFLLSASYTRTFNNHEWQAWYIPADVPFSSLSANFEVAKFSDTQASADEIEIEAVTSGTLAANTPYLVRLKDDKATGEYSIVADESAGLKETVENEFNIGSNYKLKTTYRELSGEELKGKYALSEGKFKKAGDSATLKPFRVYLEPVTTGAADVLDLVMDGATDITLTPSSGKGAETIYNLNGQAVGEDYKGIVIKNGKKVFKN